MHFGQLTIGQIEIYWPICRKMLRAAFRDKVNVNTVDDYHEPLKTGALQLWVAQEGQEVIGAVVTTVEEGSAMKVCTVISLGGERLKEWSALMDNALVDFAKSNKCQAIEAVTRKGFSRVFPDFVEDGVIYVRIIKYE